MAPYTWHRCREDNNSLFSLFLHWRIPTVLSDTTKSTGTKLNRCCTSMCVVWLLCVCTVHMYVHVMYKTYLSRDVTRHHLSIPKTGMCTGVVVRTGDHAAMGRTCIARLTGIIKGESEDLLIIIKSSFPADPIPHHHRNSSLEIEHFVS